VHLNKKEKKIKDTEVSYVKEKKGILCKLFFFSYLVLVGAGALV
jgi:hypothetical protein